MTAQEFCDCLSADFFTGVPDSQLGGFCNFLLSRYGVGSHHIIAANEGSCVGVAAGYHLATGKVPVVYLQNSGIGNIINPAVSLLHPDVFGIPCIFVVGWRGEPGKKDEPQHKFQGQITVSLLEQIGIAPMVIGPDTSTAALKEKMIQFRKLLAEGRSVAFIVQKNGIVYPEKIFYQNSFKLMREDALVQIGKAASDDIVVCTTGKASRELFEVREKSGESHERDFLTVGSMGHASSIALGIALSRPQKRVWCIDGDGAALMHFGAFATIGAQTPQNLVHVLINNQAHESVGGMPTTAVQIDFVQIAYACGYPKAVCVSSKGELDARLNQICEKRELYFLQINVSIGSRPELGRPTVTPMENKQIFMNHIIKNT